jgi:uncharacterized protein with FMN-binding domain
MKRLFKTLLARVIVIAVIIISAVAIVSVRMSGQVKAFDKSGIDPSHVADGVYNGHSETDLVKVDVFVRHSDLSDGDTCHDEIIKK